MIKLKLVLRIKNEQNFTISLGHGFRWFFFLFALIIVLVSLSDGQQGLGTGSLIICLIFLLCGSYCEAWVFNLEQDLIEQRHGFIFLFWKKLTSISHLKSVHLTTFTKGSKTGSQGLADGKMKMAFRPKKISRLYLLTNEDKKLDIEIMDDQQTERLEKIGEAIASSCQIPLLQEKD